MTTIKLIIYDDEGLFSPPLLQEDPMTDIDRLRHTWIDDLPRNACPEAVEWCSEYGTIEEAWAACRRADWMLWLAGRRCGTGSELHCRVVLAACECARKVLHLVPASESRPRAAIETAERWARCDPRVTLDGVCAAAAAAYAAADAAAADAAYAADAAAAAAAAAYAADAAAAAAVAATDAADIVRRWIPEPPIKEQNP